MTKSADDVLERLLKEFPEPNGRELFPSIEDAVEFINTFSKTEKGVIAMAMARMETTMNKKFAEAIKVQQKRVTVFEES
jgi:hypothetical protein